MSTDRPETVKNESCSERFSHSRDREILVDPDSRAGRGAEYGKFMDDFYKAADKMISEKRFANTVGGALDLAQAAFLSAAKEHPDLTAKTGAHAYLTIGDGGKDAKLTEEQLKEGKLSQNNRAEKALNNLSGMMLDVRFEKSPRNFIDEQVFSTSERSRPSKSLNDVETNGSLFDMPPLSAFMKAQN